MDTLNHDGKINRRLIKRFRERFYPNHSASNYSHVSIQSETISRINPNWESITGNSRMNVNFVAQYLIVAT